MRRGLMIVLPSALALALAACVGSNKGSIPGALKLDAARSSLTATAIKNGTKAVPVKFTGLSGWADAAGGTADLSIPVKTLSTGDLTRDYNVRTLFFEVDKLASYGTAEFKLGKVDADLSRLAEGVPLSSQGHGTLTLHGATLDLDGPLTFTKTGSSVKVTLEEGWVVAIDKTSLVEALVNLNKNCPQPHHVGNDVKLSGDLVFVP